MSVQTSNPMKAPPGKYSAVYLMRLRRRIAESTGPRRKLEVMSWARPELDIIPIRKQLARASRQSAPSEVNETGLRG